ncbi:lysozyme inhibitor LprI family protein, partial [Pseudoroseomonas deserti]|uniref:lysozyme inhibitor LprI family protein n=1 Tax=Teichococcus deserti TaxID=1817963 RepID=UPI00105660C1
MRNSLMASAAMLLALAAGSQARAQIACDRATTPIDRTICATPDLLERDRVLVEAFRGATARGDATALRQDQRGWLSRRARDCGSRRGAVLEACLRAAFDERIAALNAQAAAPAPSAAAPT